MSARDQIINMAVSTGRNPHQSRRAAERLLDAYAHELAERIRENTRARLTQVTAAHGVDWGRTWAHGRERAADLIDPEVSS